MDIDVTPATPEVKEPLHILEPERYEPIGLNESNLANSIDGSV